MRPTTKTAALFAAALIAYGCGSSEPTSDIGTVDHAKADSHADAGTADAAEADGPPTADAQACEQPTAGMKITADSVLCAGEYALADDAGEGAIQIASAGVTLRCLGTVLKGGARYGEADPSEIGIRVDQQQDVTITGCTVQGYRFGLVATASQRLTIQDNDLSDNFTNEQAEWVFDTVQGGGLRFDDVSEATVENNKLQRNFNGLDLRGCEKLTVRKNVVDHCSNAAALIIDTHRSTFEANDMSWGIRGGLTYPGNWWGVDTKDSAGMLLEAGSSYNRIIDNDLTYGGDGLFLRAVLGACPHHNHVEGNDTSYSPHNAIESWCDDNTYINNKANRSHYGFWLGGSDRTIVRGNEINENLVDGMSIQIGESRTMLIEDNEIKDNKRVGILATGREYQAWHTLDHWGDKLANASQYVIQRNRFTGNAKGDVFLSSIRGVLLAANSFGGANSVTIGKEALDVRTLAGAPTTANQPPVAALAVTDQGPQGMLLDASGSSDPEGQPLSYSWLVQPALTRFSPATMPAPLFGGDGPAQQTVAPDAAPGVYEVFLTVDDGELGGITPATTIYVPTTGQDLCEGNAGAWSFVCDQAATCKTTISAVTDQRVVGSSAIHVATDAPYLFRLERAAAAGAPWDLSAAQSVGLFARAQNPNGQGWQINSPVLVLRSASGELRLEPDTKWLASAEQTWIFLEIPLAGSAAWSKTDSGVDLAAVTHVAFEVDTFGWDPYELWLDGLSWY